MDTVELLFYLKAIQIIHRDIHNVYYTYRERQDLV